VKEDHCRGTYFRALVYVATVVQDMLNHSRKKLVANDQGMCLMLISEDSGAT